MNESAFKSSKARVRRECSGHRGITLLPATDKLFAMLILSRTRNHLVGTLKGIPATFFLKHVWTFVRHSCRYIGMRLWELFHLRGIPKKILALVRVLYTGTESTVRYGAAGAYLNSSPYPVPTEVRQGCVLAPSLFIVCMDWL